MCTNVVHFGQLFGFVKRNWTSWGFLTFKNIYLFIYVWLCWVFVAACRLSLWRAGATLRCGALASHCGDFSCCGARALGAQAQ